MKKEIELLLTNGITPEEVFGRDVVDLEDLKVRNKKLLVVVHPDQNLNCQAEAQEASARLSALFTRAEKRLAAQVYGDPAKLDNCIQFTVGKINYVFDKRLAKGSVSTVYSGYTSDTPEKKFVAKVSNSKVYNSILRHEAEVLGLMAIGLEDPVEMISRSVASFTIKDRTVNILASDEYKYYTLAEALKKYPEGLDPKHIVWIANRILRALGAVNQVSYAHGGLNMDHILINPETHKLKIVDWKYSALIGGKPSAYAVESKEDYPPEFFTLKKLAANTDIYMFGLCMLKLAGAKDGKCELKDTTLPVELFGIFKCCLLGAGHRPQYAGVVYDLIQNAVYKELRWKKEFVKFEM